MRTARAGRRGAPGERRDRLPADDRHRAGRGDGRVAPAPPRGRRRPAPDRRPPRGAVHLSDAPALTTIARSVHPTGRTSTRRWRRPGQPDDARAGDSRGAELIDAPSRAASSSRFGHTEADRPPPTRLRPRRDRGHHVFNAMRRPEPRDPGPAFAALGRDDVFVTADRRRPSPRRRHGPGRLARRRRAPRPGQRRGRRRRVLRTAPTPSVAPSRSAPRPGSSAPPTARLAGPR